MKNLFEIHTAEHQQQICIVTIITSSWNLGI